MTRETNPVTNSISEIKNIVLFLNARKKNLVLLPIHVHIVCATSCLCILILFISSSIHVRVHYDLLQHQLTCDLNNRQGLHRSNRLGMTLVKKSYYDLPNRISVRRRVYNT